MRPQSVRTQCKLGSLGKSPINKAQMSSSTQLEELLAAGHASGSGGGEGGGGARLVDAVRIGLADQDGRSARVFRVLGL